MMKIFNSLFYIFFLLLCISSPSYAITPKTTQPAKKPRVVLMPIKVSVEDLNLAGAMETALVEGLQERYIVFSGERVQQKTREIFTKESKTAKAQCDETKCMEDIAIAFQAELIAVANVTKQDGGYFLAINIQNIFDNKVLYTKSKAYANQTAFEVIDKLKELTGTKTAVDNIPVIATTLIEEKAVKSNPSDAESALWTEVQNGNTEDDYNVYLDTYKNGKYVPLAKARLKKIKDTVLEQVKEKEQQAWDTAQRHNNESSYESYLASYPDGTFAGLAKVRQNKLKTDRIASTKEALKQKPKETPYYTTQVIAGDSNRGKTLSARCVACHGTNFQKAALGKSVIVQGQPAYSIQASLQAYKVGTQNKAGMGAIMKGQTASLSDNDIKDIAAYIATIR